MEAKPDILLEGRWAWAPWVTFRMKGRPRVHLCVPAVARTHPETWPCSRCSLCSLCACMAQLPRNTKQMVHVSQQPPRTPTHYPTHPPGGHSHRVPRTRSGMRASVPAPLCRPAWPWEEQQRTGERNDAERRVPVRSLTPLIAPECTCGPPDLSGIPPHMRAPLSSRPPRPTVRSGREQENKQVEDHVTM